MPDFFKEILTELGKRDLNKKEINRLKNKLAKKYELKRIPTDAEILLHADDISGLRLITKPTRTLSGVAPIALMCKPHKCPHGTCIYCPGGPNSVFGDVPQSYTGKEPSTMRSIRNKYDPYFIVFNRLEQYVVLNQNPEKTEIIIQGGTFLSLDSQYKEEFVMYIYKAMNDFSDKFYSGEFNFSESSKNNESFSGHKKSEINFLAFKKFFELPGDINDKNRIIRIHDKLSKIKSSSTLVKEQLRNETSKIRCVGLTIETKPDYGLLEHGNEMLRFGCTRVELGVQAIDNKILKFVNRGHGTKEIIKSTRILKDLGFKINYHMMPGLPLSNPKKDVQMLKETLENPDFRPDMFKIYPTMVMKGTALYKMWQKGKYTPITTKVAADIIAKFKKHIPYWIRIMRVQRDIPTYLTDAGVDRTNLRQYINVKCKCIRCREAGLRSRIEKVDSSNIKIFIEEYEASMGEEFFISFEDPNRDILFGYARLRFPSQFLRKEITNDSALLRELHVVGSAVGVGEEGKMQHRGLGKKLLEKAEEIAKKHGKNKMVVISGVGAKEYYRKFGYKKEGPYMLKPNLQYA